MEVVCILCQKKSEGFPIHGPCLWNEIKDNIEYIERRDLLRIRITSEKENVRVLKLDEWISIGVGRTGALAVIEIHFAKASIARLLDYLARKR